MVEPNSFDKGYLSGFHYYVDHNMGNAPFSKQCKSWFSLPSDERARLNTLANRSRYRGEDQSMVKEAAGINQYYKSSYNAFQSIMVRKTGYINQEQWSRITPEQIQGLQGLFVPDTLDISSMNVEQVNELVAHHKNQIWNDRQKNQFRQLIPSQTGNVMSSSNKAIGEAWRQLSPAQQAKYERISMLSKLKWADDYPNICNPNAKKEKQSKKTITTTTKQQEKQQKMNELDDPGYVEQPPQPRKPPQTRKPQRPPSPSPSSPSLGESLSDSDLDSDSNSDLDSDSE